MKATDTSGTVTLRRDSAAAALKKAAELTNDGCWDVQIGAPDGHVYESTAFAELRADAEAHSD